MPKQQAAQVDPGGAADDGASTRVYRDAQDAATIPKGNDLLVSASEIEGKHTQRLEVGRALK